LTFSFSISRNIIFSNFIYKLSTHGAQTKRTLAFARESIYLQKRVFELRNNLKSANASDRCLVRKCFSFNESKSVMLDAAIASYKQIE